MATQQQITKWCSEVYDMIAAGEQSVDELIRKRKSRMGTLMALNVLVGTDKIIREGNCVWPRGQKKNLGESPF